VLGSANPSVREFCCCGIGQTAGAVTGRTVAGITVAATNPAEAGPRAPARRARATVTATDDSRRRPKISAPAVAAEPAAIGTASAAKGPRAAAHRYNRIMAPSPRPELRVTAKASATIPTNK
jgi:hypothetical protein